MAKPGPDQAYGIAAVSEKLKNLHFPVKKQALLDSHGQDRVQWTKAGEAHPLRHYLERIGMEEFRNVTDITHAISQAIRDEKSAGTRVGDAKGTRARASGKGDTNGKARGTAAGKRAKPVADDDLSYLDDNDEDE